jgi:hypothetical protein
MQKATTGRISYTSRRAHENNGLKAVDLLGHRSEQFAPDGVCSRSVAALRYAATSHVTASDRSQQHVQELWMPFYHFDLINSRTVADEGGAELPDDIVAMDSADALARRLLDEHPDLRNRHFSVLVTNDDGDEICRVPLDILH